MKTINLYKSPRKAIRLMLLTAPFIAIGIWMVMREPAWSFPFFIGCISIAFFGMGIPLGLMNLLDRRPQIILSAEGIFDRSLGPQIIPWKAIEEAYPLSIRGEKFICLVLDGALAPQGKKSRFRRVVARMNQAVGAQEWNLNLSQIQLNDTQVALLARAISHWEADDRYEKLVKALA